jgi:hypothetical protein
MDTIIASVVTTLVTLSVVSVLAYLVMRYIEQSTRDTDQYAEYHRTYADDLARTYKVQPEPTPPNRSNHH